MVYIEELVHDGGMEGYKIEYKERLNHDDVVGWLKTIAGFANAEGGSVYVGVNDKSHKLVGFERHEASLHRLL